MKKDVMKIGIIGCGNISACYLGNLGKSPLVRVDAVADLIREKAAEQALKFKIPRVLGPDELLKDKNIDLVLNLTIPAVHGKVALAALRNNKHVYNEKPLAAELREARDMVALARKKKLRIGCAPDTVLGGGWQFVRKQVDSGILGTITGGTGFLIGRGPEKWHPSPEFFFKKGAGPLFDMGPYYLTALVMLLGPVKKVSATAKITYPVRTIMSAPLRGKKIKVETPTHVCALLEFASGPAITLTVSFDGVTPGLPNLELFGEKGCLRLLDPNQFSGTPVLLDLEKETRFNKFNEPFQANSRGLGLVDMVMGIHENRPHRANGDLALHVLEVMHGILESARRRRTLSISSDCERPKLLPASAVKWMA